MFKIWNSELKPLTHSFRHCFFLFLSLSLPAANCYTQLHNTGVFFYWILVFFCSILFDLQLAAASSILLLSFMFSIINNWFYSYLLLLWMPQKIKKMFFFVWFVKIQDHRGTTWFVVSGFFHFIVNSYTVPFARLIILWYEALIQIVGLYNSILNFQPSQLERLFIYSFLPENTMNFDSICWRSKWGNT